MIYSNIIQCAMDGFYKHDIEFPDELSYPILFWKEGKIYDLFFMENEDSLSGEGEPSIGILYIQNVQNADENHIFEKKEDVAKFLSSKEKIDAFTFDAPSTESFSYLYAKVREFVFSKIVSPEQKNIALKLASFYDKKLDQNYSAFYKRLSPEFFSWVKNLMTQ